MSVNLYMTNQPKRAVTLHGWLWGRGCFKVTWRHLDLTEISLVSVKSSTLFLDYLTIVKEVSKNFKLGTLDCPPFWLKEVYIREGPYQLGSSVFSLLRYPSGRVCVRHLGVTRTRNRFHSHFIEFITVINHRHNPRFCVCTSLNFLS